MVDQIKQNPVRAALIITAACALFAATTILAKALGNPTLGEPLHPLEVSAGRYVFAFIGVYIFSRKAGVRIRPQNLGLHAARTSCGWLGVTLLFAAVARMPLSDATAISFLNPVFAMILAIPLLGERIGPFRWAGAAIALIGAMVLLRPGQSSIQPAALIALAAAVMIGFEAIFVKKLTRREPPLQILLMNNFMGAIIGSCAAMFIWQLPNAQQWLALISVGIIMVLGQALYLQAMRRADASFVVPFTYFILAFATLYDFWVFGVVPDNISLIGAGIILFGAFILVWRDQRQVR